MATVQTTQLTEDQEFTMQNIVAIHEHEGIKLSQETIELSKKVLVGEMTGDEAVQRILAE